MPAPLHPVPKIRSRICFAVNASQPIATQAEAELCFLAWLLDASVWQREAAKDGPALWASGVRLLPGGRYELAPTPGHLSKASSRLPKGLFDAAWEVLQKSRINHGAAPRAEVGTARRAALRARWRPDGPNLPRSPLISAVLSSDFAEVKTLLEHGVNVNQQTPEKGDTALHFALWTDHLDEASILLDAGASPFVINKNGQSPLHVFSRKMVSELHSNSRLEMLVRLLPGAVNIIDSDGNLAHHYLLSSGDAKAVKLIELLLKNAPLSCFKHKNNKNNTPMDVLLANATPDVAGRAADLYRSMVHGHALEKSVASPIPLGRIRI
jgi:hypothetical protein